MPNFTCPSCQCQIEVDRAGQRVLCGSCGESVYIAAATSAVRPRPAAEVPTPVVAAETPGVRVRTGKRKKKNPWPNIIVHCLISATAMVAAYKFIVEPRLNRPMPKPANVAVKPEAATPRPRPRVSPAVSTPAIKPEPEAAPEPRSKEPPTPAWAAKRTNPFDGFPSFVDLPLATERGTVGITGRVDAKLDLLAFDDTLKIDGTRVVHGDKTVAGIRVGDGLIEFKWIKDAPPESVDAVRNAVLKLTAGDEVHHLALRSPIKVKAKPFNLERSTLHLHAKLESLPPAEHVMFSMAPPAQFPIAEVTGHDPARLKLHDQTTFKYRGADSATRIDVRKVGRVATASLDSRYVLPSGDAEPLSIPRGNRKLTELENLFNDALDAQQSISRLRSYRQRLNSNLRSAQNMRTMVNGFENPAAAAARALAIGQVSNEIAATERNIARAEQLIADKPSIERDLAAIRQVAELARSLHKTPIPYRFFMIVDGVEVDLLIAE